MKKIVMLAAVAGFALSTNVMAQDGKAVYEKSCVTCHSIGLAGAPKFQNKAEWAPRLAKGMDALVASVNNGLNAMPAKGACIDCNDEDYKAAIQYMSGQ
ncbi:c-type cytochrome [uncultured Ferrimonas sp.]|uniref:c-type cytochrome n=1 Tax=uncultured Ferrimonas sp. TaxID=432640 RepID=UPI0026396866|nr:c-type cytochrome [uncultured Ferrimonas sp.]